ncbi:hypothetical protein BASA81_011626 [Batrachochytrium salamandrivorans]|nr:hypothetical protein BASA81_011626 [Batrachochytrium salamandrivorans]
MSGQKWKGTRVDIDTVVEGADSEMCSVKEYLKAVASSSAIIMSKLEVLGSSPHVPQFLNQPSYAMMASHPPVNTPTTRTAVRKPSAVTVAAPASLVPPVKITRGGILNTPLPTMSHQAARVLLRTEPEQQASVAARFQKHQAATRSQILPPAALPDIENAHKCRILILQMPRTMPFKEVRDILRPFCTTNCIWDMCWLDSTRLQIIIDDHEVMRLRGSAFQLGNITCAAIADPRAAPFPSATAEEKNISHENMGGENRCKQYCGLPPFHAPENFSMMLSKHQGKLLCNMRQNWRKIFFDQHHMVLPYHV